MFIRGFNNYDVDAASVASGLSCPEKSLTQQSQKEDADINTIVRRFGVTGQLPQNLRLPQYGDFNGVENFQDALHAVAEAEREFLKIPAEIRSKFQNDPQAFLDFCGNPENLPELRKLGLAPDVPAPKSSSEV